MADTTILKGSKLYICATAQNDDLNQAGYEGLTWVEIAKIVTMPMVGSVDNIVSQDYVDTTVSQYAKGFANAGQSQIVVGRDWEDAGQDALRTAAATPFNYAFKIEANDGVSGVTTPTTWYTRGVIGGPMTDARSGEDFQNESFECAFNQQAIAVDPAAV